MNISLQVLGKIPMGHFGDPEGEHCVGKRALNEQIPKFVVSERVSPGLVVDVCSGGRGCFSEMMIPLGLWE